ncbi:hypothetical protein CDG77_21060 [Nostoc sp. 'Peltigera membranacea cyanobiont' 213]|nr:hypothetical protein CDG77_21060 [Nostoc sp. 'Peltigera membranacea cyanobiont' 213]
MPAYTASTSMLVPKEHLPRASGMVQSAEACAQLISPLLAGVLLGVTTCNTNRSNLQSRHLQTRIKCNYNCASARINCN